MNYTVTYADSPSSGTVSILRIEAASEREAFREARERLDIGTLIRTVIADDEDLSPDFEPSPDPNWMND